MPEAKQPCPICHRAPGEQHRVECPRSVASQGVPIIGRQPQALQLQVGSDPTTGQIAVRMSQPTNQLTLTVEQAVGLLRALMMHLDLVRGLEPGVIVRLEKDDGPRLLAMLERIEGQGGDRNDAELDSFISKFRELFGKTEEETS